MLSVKLVKQRNSLLERERPKKEGKAEGEEDKKGDLGENILDYNLSSQSFYTQP